MKSIFQNLIYFRYILKYLSQLRGSCKVSFIVICDVNRQLAKQMKLRLRCFVLRIRTETSFYELKLRLLPINGLYKVSACKHAADFPLGKSADKLTQTFVK